MIEFGHATLEKLIFMKKNKLIDSLKQCGAVPSNTTDELWFLRNRCIKLIEIQDGNYMVKSILI